MAEPSADMFDRLAHDLRGPLTPLRTAAFLLRRGDQPAERQQDLLEIIDRQTARLSCMLQEVADWQSLAQGRLQVRREISELDMLLAPAIEGLNAVDAIRLELDDAAKTACIAGDAHRLVQMFGSLLGYARARSVDSRVSLSGHCVDAGVVVAIRYHPGDDMPANGEQRIDFTRPEASPFDEGLGWRLMIANAIALANGGTLAIEPDRGDGLVGIHVQLPVQPVSS